MRKRLRKKKHVGEFKEFGVQIIIRRNTLRDYDEFIWAFVEEAVEFNDCYCGGGGMEDKCDMYIELGRSADDPMARLKGITDWLDSRGDVESYRVGEINDAWYGPFEDLEEEE